MGHRLREILLQQREAVGDILRASQEFVEQSEHFEIRRLEQLFQQRAEQIQLIERLEDERRQLTGDVNGSDVILQPLQADIQEALSVLTTFDDRLKDMVFNRQLQLINNMAFTPKFLNLNQNKPSDRHPARRVVDITR